MKKTWNGLTLSLAILSGCGGGTEVISSINQPLTENVTENNIPIEPPPATIPEEDERLLPDPNIPQGFLDENLRGAQLLLTDSSGSPLAGYIPTYSAIDHRNNVTIAVGQARISTLGGGSFTLSLIAKILPDGRLDRSFGSNGFSLIGASGIEPFDPLEGLQYVHILPDGKFLVAGTMINRGVSPNQIGIRICKFMPNGAFDPSFNSGLCLRMPGQGNGMNYHLKGFKVLEFGNDFEIFFGRQLVETTNSQTFFRGSTVQRRLSNGTSFQDFVVVPSSNNDISESLYAFDVTNDRKVAALTFSGGPTVALPIVRKYLANLSPDLSFGSSQNPGLTTILPAIEIDPRSSQAALKFGTNESLTMAFGDTIPGMSGDILVTRIAANGGADSAFNNNQGFLRIQNRMASLSQLHLAASGHIYLSATVTELAKENAALYRLRPDGQLDGNFGVGGRLLWTPSATTRAFGAGFTFTTTNRILMLGNSGVGYLFGVN